MLAKVQYPGPSGEPKQFNAEVPDSTPTRYTFRSPEDGTPIEAELVNATGSLQPAGGVAIYRAVEDEA